MNLLREKCQMEEVSAEFQSQIDCAEETLSRVIELLFDKCSHCFSFVFGNLLKALEEKAAKKDDDSAFEGVEDKFKVIK